MASMSGEVRRESWCLMCADNAASGAEAQAFEGLDRVMATRYVQYIHTLITAPSAPSSLSCCSGGVVMAVCNEGQ
jgi:hypothetical protein